MRIAGYTLPFFPMRPIEGLPVRKSTVNMLWDDINSGIYVAQRKLNGDRALVGVADGEVKIANRHGRWYQHTVSNMKDFEQLPSGTLLDGEVYKKTFYPFEVLALKNQSLMNEGPELRCAEAEVITEIVELPWIFGDVTLEWLQRLGENLPQWEGVVLKEKSSTYVPLGSETRNSTTWFKRKWY